MDQEPSREVVTEALNSLKPEWLPFHSSDPILIFSFSGTAKQMILHAPNSKLCYQLTAESSTRVDPWATRVNKTLLLSWRS